eukprot:12405580-Karenia_brevis.AAC.1
MEFKVIHQESPTILISYMEVTLGWALGPQDGCDSRVGIGPSGVPWGRPGMMMVDHGGDDDGDDDDDDYDDDS